MKSRILAAISVVTLTMAGLIALAAYAVNLRRNGPLSAGQVQWATVGLIGAGVITLAVLAFWIFVAPRHVVGSLSALNTTAHDIADQRLPAVVNHLARGGAVSVDTALPASGFGPDEFGELGRAILHLGQQAVSSTVEAARQRNQGELTATLARRVQGNVLRQLRALDGLERRTEDPELLDGLYTVDQAAVQLRRYTENLLILAGHSSGRRWTRPLRMVDVVRGAVAEVTDYRKVEVAVADRETFVKGEFAADVMHLLAELIDNATRFSPPHTRVEVGGEPVAHGFAVEIMDRGLGPDEAVLAALNDRLRNPAEILAVGREEPQLGLHVVGHLAKRRGVTVTLSNSPYGGTTAIVLIAPHLLDTAPATEGVAAPPA